MIDGEVTLFEDGCQLELVGCHLVVARLTGNGQLQRLYLQVFHKCLHAVGDGAEVVVVHLLVLCRLVSQQGASRHEQVGAGRVEPFIDEEILLFPAEVYRHLLYVGIEEAADIRCGLIDGM